MEGWDNAVRHACCRVAYFSRDTSRLQGRRAGPIRWSVWLLAVALVSGSCSSGSGFEGRLVGDSASRCAWTEARTNPGQPASRRPIVLPRGYRIDYDPVRLVGPDGAVIAEEGDFIISPHARDNPRTLSLDHFRRPVCEIPGQEPVFILDEITKYPEQQ